MSFLSLGSVQPFANVSARASNPGNFPFLLSNEQVAILAIKNMADVADKEK